MNSIGGIYPNILSRAAQKRAPNGPLSVDIKVIPKGDRLNNSEIQQIMQLQREAHQPGLTEAKQAGAAAKVTLPKSVAVFKKLYGESSFVIAKERKSGPIIGFRVSKRLSKPYARKFKRLKDVLSASLAFQGEAVVKKGFRQKTVARELLRAVRSHFGCKYYVFSVYSGNTPTIKAITKLGGIKFAEDVDGKDLYYADLDNLPSTNASKIKISSRVH